jgi:hypothetical protein
MRILLVLISLAFSACAFAKPQIVSWEMPTGNCDATTLDAADLLEFELIYDTEPMPMPSDTTGPCDEAADPEAPSTATTVPVPVTETSTILNLQPGVTYYFRARVSAYIEGNWSSWSVQISKTVPYGRPDRVLVTDGGFKRWEFELVSDDPITIRWGKS